VPVSVRVDRERAWLATAEADHTQAKVRAAIGAAAKWTDGGHYFASGIENGHYNVAHVLDADAFDVRDARAWFAAQNAALALRTTIDVAVKGTRVRHNVIMQVTQDDLRHSTGQVPVRRATSDDLNGLVTVDREAFGPSDPEPLRAWIGGHLISDDIVTGVIELVGSPVATGYVVLSEGEAGRTAQIGGIAVVPMMKRRGLGDRITTWLADYAFDHGADIVHLYTDSDVARRLYTRLGFREVGTFNVYIDVEP
jgi:ribosomal protein S18 acetylase RimI-like enzyme